MARWVMGSLIGALGAVNLASAAEPIAELRTNPACAAAFDQEVRALRQMTDVGKRLVPGNPPSAASCRDARQVVRLDDLHYRLETRMYATCHQDGSAVLSGEAARLAHLQQTIIPRYCP